LIRYTFQLDSANSVHFEVEEDSDTSQETGIDQVPGWMKLEFFRCDHCSLSPGSRKTCPAALSIRPVIDAFSKCLSFETVQALVESRDLKVQGEMSAQKAVRSLLGLLMALSACPTMRKLRPMAHFHLPFGTKEHTSFRFLGTYLMAQHLRLQAGESPDWELTGLQEFIREIHKTNKNMAERIRAAAEMDAVVNSLVFLDALAMSLEHEIETSLSQIKPLFAGYLE
jgi:hypothetical protein